MNVQHEVDSPTMPGMKSCVTESLEEYCTFNSLFDQILNIIRDPLVPTENFLLKSLTVTEDGPEEFTVKVIHDAKKLETFGWGKEDGTDRVRSWVKVWHSRSKRELITEEYHEDGRMEIRCTARFLSDPLRIEFWGDHVSGARRCGKFYAAVVKHMFIVPSLKSLVKRKVYVAHSVRAVDGHGVSCLSDPLDDYATYDGLMYLLLDVLKSPAKKGKFEFTEIAENQFEIKLPGPPIRPPEGDEPPPRVTLTTLYKWDYERGQINAVISVGNDLLHTAWIRVHKDPLRLEYWIEEGVTRLAGRMETVLLQEIVDAVVRKAEGLDGWFF